MIKQHKLLFETLLEKFTEDETCWFFCNENEDFSKLWGDKDFVEEMRKFVQSFTDEFYPQESKIQESVKSDDPLFVYGCNDNQLRVEFLNWLIPQL